MQDAAAATIALAGFSDILANAPLAILLAGAIAVLVLDLFARRVDSSVVALATLAASFVSLWTLYAVQSDAIAGDGLASFSGALRMGFPAFCAANAILISAVMMILVSPRYLRDRVAPRGEYYVLMLFAAASMVGLACSAELVVLFLNLEILSIALYVLAGIERENLRSTEAAFKYFLMGAYSSAFLLFGLALLYGATGSTQLETIGLALANGTHAGPAIVAAGVALMLVGFAFKMTLAPFHMYAPDLYAGAPTPVAGFIATGSKAAALASMVAFFEQIARWKELPDGLLLAFCLVAVLAMIVGNVGAVTQTNIKRLLAYSGVAHAGYAMVPLAAMLATAGRADHAAIVEHARSAIAYYVVAYGLMTALAFAAIATFGPQGESHIDRYAGLATTRPALAAAMALALVSLTGVPPTAGFIGKFGLFSAGVEAGLMPLAIGGVLASVASAYYYLRVIVKMYMEPAAAPRPPGAVIGWRNFWALTAGAVGILLVAFFPILL